MANKRGRPPMPKEQRDSYILIAQRLKDARKATGYSQRTVAARAGISKTAYYFYEKGRSIPRDEMTMEAIAQVLGVKSIDIYGVGETCGRNSD